MAILFFLIIFAYCNFFHKKTSIRTFAALIGFIVMLLIFVFSLPYMYGNDIQVKVIDEYVFDVSEEEYLKNSDLQWFSVYSKYGLGSPSRFNRDTIGIANLMEFDSKYTYIVSYGRRITSICYNNWDLIRGTPILDLGTSPKKATIFTEHVVNTEKLYIYKVNRVRIDNDW